MVRARAAGHEGARAESQEPALESGAGRASRRVSWEAHGCALELDLSPDAARLVKKALEGDPGNQSS